MKKKLKGVEKKKVLCHKSVGLNMCDDNNMSGLEAELDFWPGGVGMFAPSGAQTATAERCR